MRIVTKRIHQEIANLSDISSILNKEQDRLEIITNMTIMSSEIEFYEELVNDFYNDKGDKTVIGLKSGVEFIILCNYEVFCDIMEKIYHESMATFNRVKLN